MIKQCVTNTRRFSACDRCDRTRSASSHAPARAVARSGGTTRDNRAGTRRRSAACRSRRTRLEYEVVRCFRPCGNGSSLRGPDRQAQDRPGCALRAPDLGPDIRAGNFWMIRPCSKACRGCIHARVQAKAPKSWPGIAISHPGLRLPPRRRLPPDRAGNIDTWIADRS